MIMDILRFANNASQARRIASALIVLECATLRYYAAGVWEDTDGELIFSEGHCEVRLKMRGPWHEVYADGEWYRAKPSDRQAGIHVVASVASKSSKDEID
jgi:hypothetical protein